jgi:thiamine-phosphate pyrophosphorylase
MTESNLDIAKMAQAIIDTHSARFGLAATVPSAQFFGQASAYRAAKSACMAMNFIEADAECLARAWQAQTERLGQFDATLWPAAPVDFGMQPLPAARRPDAFAPCPKQLGLYAVLPDAKWTARCARAGVPTVQLRFKSDDDMAVEQEVRAAVDSVRGTSALLFINDHWRAAIAAGAYGVHLGQEDLDALSPDELAQIRAAGLRLGVSTHGYAEMVRADAVSPSYIAMGAVFPTTLKRMATAPQGLARLDAYAKLTSQYAQVAIGGIDAERLPAVLATGVGSVAMVRAIIAADDPEAACRELGALVDSATGRRAAH